MPNEAQHANDTPALLMNDNMYDILVAWGRRWLPLLATILLVVAGVFTQISAVPGLETAAPVLAIISGILSAIGTGINELLKKAKEAYTVISQSDNSGETA